VYFLCRISQRMFNTPMKRETDRFNFHVTDNFICNSPASLNSISPSVLTYLQLKKLSYNLLVTGKYQLHPTCNCKKYALTPHLQLTNLICDTHATENLSGDSHAILKNIHLQLKKQSCDPYVSSKNIHLQPTCN
jgi:hypothetical protein